MTRLPIVCIIDDDASVRVAVERIVRSMDLAAYSFASCRDFLDFAPASQCLLYYCGRSDARNERVGIAEDY